MSYSKTEIECFVDNAVEEVVLEIFKNEFSSFKELEYAIEYLQEKIQELDAEDFEDSLV
jgi:hypothetical protein